MHTPCMNYSECLKIDIQLGTSDPIFSIICIYTVHVPVHAHVQDTVPGLISVVELAATTDFGF